LAPAVSTTAAAAVAASSSALPPLAPVVTMNPGFLVPSNASALPAQQTSITEFTGAAARGVTMSGWQVGVAGLGALFVVLG